MQQPTTPLVWLIDDDEDDQLFIGSAFREAYPSVAVLTLSDGGELLPALAQSTQRPKLILLDVNMPRMNGFETLKELRCITEYTDLPVVVLTTSSADENRQRSLALGPTSF